MLSAKAPLRAHNAAYLEHWLDHDYPDRIAGRMPPETMIISSRQLTASVPLKKGAYDRIDNLWRARLGVDEEGNQLSPKELGLLLGRDETDKLLLYLTDQYLREKAEQSGQARDHLIHRVAKQVLLCEEEAGGFVYLAKLERMGRNNHTIRTVAQFARAAVTEILDELDRLNFRLGVGEDPYKRGWAKRKVAMDYDGTRRRLARERQELIDAGMSKVKATKRVAEKNGCSPSKVEKSVKWMRDNEKNLGDILRMKTA